MGTDRRAKWNLTTPLMEPIKYVIREFQYGSYLRSVLDHLGVNLIADTYGTDRVLEKDTSVELIQTSYTAYGTDRAAVNNT